jgi:hypothetical protein
MVSSIRNARDLRHVIVRGKEKHFWTTEIDNYFGAAKGAFGINETATGVWPASEARASAFWGKSCSSPEFNFSTFPGKLEPLPSRSISYVGFFQDPGILPCNRFRSFLDFWRFVAFLAISKKFIGRHPVRIWRPSGGDFSRNSETRPHI